jgi:hypothetical protein
MSSLAASPSTGLARGAGGSILKPPIPSAIGRSANPGTAGDPFADRSGAARDERPAPCGEYGNGSSIPSSRRTGILMILARLRRHESPYNIAPNGLLSNCYQIEQHWRP